MKYPLFPLSSHVLPEGRLALRIFEPRYLRMVKEVCEKESFFVICMLDNKGNKEENTHIYPLGTLCKVIDFDVLEDGLLGITVEGVSCVSVSDIETEADELRVGSVEQVDAWKGYHSVVEENANIATKLKDVFEEYPEIAELYDTLKFDDTEWVVNRWLELLPVTAEQKQFFLETRDTKVVVEYLNQLIE